MTTFSSVLPASVLGSRDWRSLASLIDLTLLRPDATTQAVEQACAAALHYGFAAVFVHPALLPDAVAQLRGTGTLPGIPIGFPAGAQVTAVKRFEALEAVKAGARELDVVLNIGALKDRNRTLVKNDIKAVVEVAREAGAVTKVILETPLLTIDEKILACELSIVAGADFVKTCTGLHGAATVADVALLRGVAGDRIRVKASGGIRTAAECFAMLDAGADRIGTSTPVDIMRELGAPEVL